MVRIDGADDGGLRLQGHDVPFDSGSATDARVGDAPVPGTSGHGHANGRRGTEPGDDVVDESLEGGASRP